MATKQDFLVALRENPADEVTRRVYADWLEEQGLDDEAEIQRNWTPEAYHKAVELVEDYANECDVTPEELLVCATHFLDTGDRMYLPFDTPEMACVDQLSFWLAYQILTGRPVMAAYDKDECGLHWVSCSC